MDRLQAIEGLRADLASATAAADWDALAKVSAALAAEMPALAARGPWTAPERAALALLRALHAHAFQLCSDEKHRMALELGNMLTNKEGWLAYALVGETELDGN